MNLQKVYFRKKIKIEQKIEELTSEIYELGVFEAVCHYEDSRSFEQELGKINHRVGKYANIKGEFTPSQLAKIYDKSITSLSMGADHIFDFVSNMSTVF